MTFTHTGFDFSYHQGAIDFKKVKDYGTKFLVLRCGYAQVKDLRFDQYMVDSLPYFPYVSTYHYYDPTAAPLSQANKVIQTLAPYKSRIRRVWLDLEFSWAGAYAYPSDWKKYRDAIVAAGYRVGWYTRQTWWDNRFVIGSVGYIDPAIFATDPLWAAQYNTTLTLIPKGWKGLNIPAMLWQKGTPVIGEQVGTESLEVDLDLWNDHYNFEQEWGAPLQNDDPITLSLFNDQARYERRTLTSPRKITYHYGEIDLSQAEIIVSPPNANGRLDRMTILEFMQKFNCDMAVNADEPYFYSTLETYLKRRAMSKGIKYGIQTDGATLSLTKYNQLGLSWLGYRIDAYNAVSGSRILVENSQIASFMDLLPPDPRTVLGWKDGKLMWLVIDGRGESLGATLLESATLMQGLGAEFAINADGGGSSAFAIRNLGIMNRPSDGVLRDVGHYIGVRFTGANMAKNKVTVTWDAGARERQDPHAAGVYGATLPDNSIHYSDFDEVPDMDDPTNPNKRWIKLQSGWYIATYYPPSSGTIYERARVEPIVQPPSGEVIEATLVEKDALGSIVATWKGTLTKQ